MKAYIYILLIVSLLAGITNIINAIEKDHNKLSYIVAIAHFIIIILILTNI